MTNVELVLQGPGRPPSLRERLTAASNGADSGGAMFAWTNASGAKELLQDSTFTSFLKSGNFDLIVGTDSITDENAVDVLIAAEASAANLTVRAFVNDSGSLYHPKLAWFVHGSQVTLLVGSGNLTMGGLTKNWEAFVIVVLSGEPAIQVLRQLKEWQKTWSAALLPISDPSVRARASQNRGQERDLKRLAARLPKKSKDLDPQLDVLVAEVSRSRGGWTQVNFHKPHFETFFGADLSSLPRFIRTRRVRDNGSLSPIEDARGIVVASQNYRFEFEGPRGRAYPDDPPIGVHVRLGPDDFLYLFREPDDAGYAELDALLGPSTGRMMRQRRFTLGTLVAAWPATPLSKVNTDSAY